MSKETFQEKFSENPRRDDLTLLAPKQDDPTEQVQGLIALWFACQSCPCNRQHSSLSHLSNVNQLLGR